MKTISLINRGLLPAALVLLAAAGCRDAGQRARQTEPPATEQAALKTIRVTDDVPYREGDSRSWVLDLAEPENFGPETRPVIVLIHGGGWRMGSKQERVFRSMLLHYANLGYVAVSLDYRLDGEAPFPACIADVKCAVRWIKANAARLRIDPDRIGAYGHSAGGHLAVMLAVSADNPELEGDGPWREHSSAIACAVGGAASTQRHQPKRFWEPRYAHCWPIHYLSADRPPLLFLQGEADQTVDPAIVKDYVAKAKAAGADVEYIGVPDLGHDVSYTLALDITQPAMDEFFAEHLQK
ncbi:MAG: alpha/beta hydrolase [Alistipes sp.]|jgi:acetyl esterase/lipase|nr:alpha/beta hydrolase [Alistipes sp.]